MKAYTRTTTKPALPSQIGAIRAVCRQTRQLVKRNAKALNVYQESNMKVEVKTGLYQITHGHKPRGQGNWMFSINGYFSNWQGLYSEVRKLAIQEAKKRGISAIVVMP